MIAVIAALIVWNIILTIFIVMTRQGISDGRLTYFEVNHDGLWYGHKWEGCSGSTLVVPFPWRKR